MCCGPGCERGPRWAGLGLQGSPSLLDAPSVLQILCPSLGHVSLCLSSSLSVHQSLILSTRCHPGCDWCSVSKGKGGRYWVGTNHWIRAHPSDLIFTVKTPLQIRPRAEALEVVTHIAIIRVLLAGMQSHDLTLLQGSLGNVVFHWAVLCTASNSVAEGDVGGSPSPWGSCRA